MDFYIKMNCVTDYSEPYDRWINPDGTQTFMVRREYSLPTFMAKGGVYAEALNLSEQKYLALIEIARKWMYARLYAEYNVGWPDRVILHEDYGRKTVDLTEQFRAEVMRLGQRI